MRNKTFDIIFNTVLMSVPGAILLWSFILIEKFNVKNNHIDFLMRAYKVAFHAPNITWISYSSIFISILIFAVGNYFYYNSSLSGHFKNKDHVRGANMATDKKLSSMTKEKKAQITIGGVPIPTKLETLHFLLGGSTGAGKSFAITEMLEKIILGKDRVIVVDPNAEFFSKFCNKGRGNDTILNPFDPRGQGWSIYNEVRDNYDYDRFAKSVIPPARSNQDAEWHGYAQLLFAETAKKLTKVQGVNTESLIDWLTVRPMEELKTLLEGTAAAGLFDPGTIKALASTRFIIARYVSHWKYLKPGDFSLRSWLENEKGGNLWITWKEGQLDSLKPLISTWTDILSTAILDLPPSDHRRVWLIIDELASLERLNSLESALTKGRKHGLRIVTGLQSTAQLELLYGREKSIVLRSCFRNLLILGGSPSDPQTAEEFSRGLGERDIERKQTSNSVSHHGLQRGTNQTESSQFIKERLVLPSEITKLPDLTGYLSLSGNLPIAKVKIKPLKLPKIAEPFEEKKCSVSTTSVEATTQENITKKPMTTTQKTDLQVNG